MKDKYFSENLSREDELDLYRFLGRRERRIDHRLAYVEGVKALPCILDSEKNIKRILVLEGREKLLDGLSVDESLILTVTEKELAQISNVKINEGIITVYETFSKSLKHLDLSFHRRLIFLENIGDPANGAGMVRSAESLGFNGIIFSGKSVDPFNPRLVRASMGSIFYLDVFHLMNIQDSLDILSKKGYSLISAVPFDGVCPSDINPGNLFVLIAGNENTGVDRETVEKSDYIVTIPMLGRMDSLNVSQAMSILMYEFGPGNRPE